MAVEDTEAALLLERELFDRGANVAVVASLDDNAVQLARAAGLIAIVTGHVPPGGLDLRGIATQEATRRIIVGHEEQLIEGEGI